jgi:hypothetical protein
MRGVGVILWAGHSEETLDALGERLRYYHNFGWVSEQRREAPLNVGGVVFD